MSELHRVHGAEHENTKDEHYAFRGVARDAECVMVGIVDLAQARQEEHERGA